MKIRFNRNLGIKDTKSRQAVQLRLIDVCQRLEGIKRDPQSTKYIALHEVIATFQDDIGRLMHFVEGYNIDQLAVQVHLNGIVEDRWVN